MDIMPIAAIPDWEMRICRTDAFWSQTIFDRPLVYITCPKPNAPSPLPISLARHWNDPEYYARQTLAAVNATEYYGDALPYAQPKIGPDIFPVLYGGELSFEDTTSFISHFISDWSQVLTLHYDLTNIYAKAVDDIYDAMLELGREHFYVGWPDLHGGGDCLAAWRGPTELCLDLFDHPDEVKSALDKVTGDLCEVYDYYTARLQNSGQAVTGWPGIVSSLKWHVPSNDFSYMISPGQFREFFLPGLRRECDYFEASIHHLDGIGCLNHLDAILEIESLNAIQWVQGTGHGDAKDWIPIYQKIQAAGKGLQICTKLSDLETILTHLHPEGIQLCMIDVPDKITAEAVVRRISKWT